MLILISPAKTLDLSNNVPDKIISSEPYFYKEALQLVGLLQKYSPQELEKLMNLSDKLSELNYQRFQGFKLKKTTKAAIYTYKGDVYEQLELMDYTQEQIEFANQHLRIISGLYGILKPLDSIKPYRLEMSINLANSKGKNLYSFWGDKLSNYLKSEHPDFIINLASQEYSISLKLPMINITFKEKVQEQYKIIGIHAKKARGLMANFIIRNLLNSPEELKSFNLNNYKYMDELSSASEYVFAR